MITLIKNDDNYAIDTTLTIKVIYIEYSGSLTLIDRTNDNVITEMGKNRILIYSIIDNINGELFNYLGHRFKITSIKFYDENGNRVYHSIQDNQIQWGNIDTNWEDITSFWGNYGAANDHPGNNINQVITKRNHPNIICSLNTDKYPVKLYDKGRLYKGDFYITDKGLIKSGKYPHKDALLLKSVMEKSLTRKRNLNRLTNE